MLGHGGKKIKHKQISPVTIKNKFYLKKAQIFNTMHWKNWSMTVIKLASFCWFGASLFLVAGALATGSEVTNGWYLVALVVGPPVCLNLVGFLGFSLNELLQRKRSNPQ